MTIEPGDTVDADFNPNQMYFDWVDGEPPEGAGDFNPPEQTTAETDELQVLELEKTTAERRGDRTRG